MAGAPLVLQSVAALADGSATPVPQPTDGISLAPRIDVADARVRWEHPALAIDRLVRSMTPAPGAWGEVAGRRVKLGPVTPVSMPRVGSAMPSRTLAPGEIEATKQAVFVGTGSESVQLSDVAPAGKQWMPAADWARGATIDGARFEATQDQA